ncbi:hypothetical protein Tco_0221780 [Tanacetum coccineum]
MSSSTSHALLLTPLCPRRFVPQSSGYSLLGDLETDLRRREKTQRRSPLRRRLPIVRSSPHSALLFTYEGDEPLRRMRCSYTMITHFSHHIITLSLDSTHVGHKKMNNGTESTNSTNPIPNNQGRVNQTELDQLVTQRVADALAAMEAN